MVILVENEEHLDQLLTEAGKKLVVIDFFASWCGPCKVIGPRLEELSNEVLDVMFLKVDVDVCETIAEKYAISSMPTFHFIKEKKPIDSFTGADSDKLEEFFLRLRETASEEEKTEESAEEEEEEAEEGAEEGE